MTDPDTTAPAVIVPDPPAPGPADPATIATLTGATVVAEMQQDMALVDAANAKAADTFQLLENQRALTVLAEAHLHEAEVKLNERDAEIVRLKTVVVGPIAYTCPTCGTRSGD